MADTRRALDALEASQADPDLVKTLLAARSDAEAAIAYAVLRESLPSRSLVMLANLRELIAELPDVPFVTGERLDLLATAGGFEHTGHSYRRLFESDHGYFGLEFIGGGTLCEGIVVHTVSSRFYLHGDERSVIDDAMLNVLMSHHILLDAVLEGLQLLGTPLEPRIYVTPDDFAAEHAAAAAGEAFSDLF